MAEISDGTGPAVQLSLLQKDVDYFQAITSSVSDLFESDEFETSMKYFQRAALVVILVAGSIAAYF